MAEVAERVKYHHLWASKELEQEIVALQGEPVFIHG